MPKKFWQFRNQAAGSAELLLYGDISDSSWWGDEVTPKTFADELNALGALTSLTVRINSGGGDVFAAQTIGNLLEQHTAQVTARIDGLCASAATIIACHCDKVVAANDSTYMIHPVRMGIFDFADAVTLQQYIGALNTIRENILNLYTKKTGREKDEVAAWMDATSWWTGEAAKTNGFVDELVDDGEKTVVENRGGLLFVNSVNMNLPFDKAPKFVQNSVAAAPAASGFVNTPTPAEQPGNNSHILDDVAYQDAPTTLQVGGVSKPSDTDFSELERETIWKNTSIKRIGESIAGRYGLGFTYDADDYDIECDEQDGTDSSYYNTLCKNYGLILKVYAKRLWVYDRERYKGKRAVQDFDRTNIIPGSLSYNTTLSGTYTGGYFTYTDADKDLDIVCSVGGGNHTKNVNRRATSVFDASVQLCAEINNANHGRVKLKFSVMGNWGVSAGNNLRLTGYGDGLNGGINGKYFVDKVTHKYTKSGGFVTSFECSGIFDPFHYWDVGGHIEYHQSEDSSSESYNSAYETTSPAANAAGAAAGATAGAAVTLTKAPFYYTSVAPKPSCYKSGTFYFYDGILVNNRYRITNTAARCGKLPVGKNVTGWVPASYCNGGGITTK